MYNKEDLPVSLTRVRCIKKQMDNQEEEEMEVTLRVQTLPLPVLLLPAEILLTR